MPYGQIATFHHAPFDKIPDISGYYFKRMIENHDISGCHFKRMNENHDISGYHFKMVDALITNFHLPKSTLVMLVSALAGREHILAAYKEAVEKKYRFFSFGDAMFIH